MDTLYIILVRWGPEWDGQSIYYTYSKALFEYIKSADLYRKTYFNDFSEELKADIITAKDIFSKEYPQTTLEDNEDIGSAMEWLEAQPKFPIIVAGETSLTCRWNW